MNKKQILIFAVLAIVIFALGAQLATAQPVELRIGNTEISFLPLIVTTKAADAPPGVLYVFSLPLSTQGDVGGRPAIMDLCPTEDPESHFCSLEEIENAWAATGVFFSSSLENAWVDTFSATYWVSDTDNCNGWTSSDSAHSGYTISEYFVARATYGCHSSMSVACCKQMP